MGIMIQFFLNKNKNYFESYNKNNETKLYSSCSTPVSQAIACLFCVSMGVWFLIAKRFLAYKKWSLAEQWFPPNPVNRCRCLESSGAVAARCKKASNADGGGGRRCPIQYWENWMRSLCNWTAAERAGCIPSMDGNASIFVLTLWLRSVTSRH